MPRRVTILPVVNPFSDNRDVPAILTYAMHNAGLRVIKRPNDSPSGIKGEQVISALDKASKDWMYLWWRDVLKRTHKVEKSRSFTGRRWWGHA